jgi:signal peptidase I
MRSSTIILIVILMLASCTPSHTLIMDDTSMEGTIKKGAELEVLPVDEILANQIVAFKYNDEYYGEITSVSRVVGLPGDTVKVFQGQLFVNGELFPEPKEVKYQYQVIIDGKFREETIKNMEYQQLNSEEYVFFLTREEAEILRFNPVVMTLRILVRDWGIARPELFGADTVNKWNLDYYGPLLVPPKGEYGATEDLYFVMSDNRHNAVDSRYIGYIPVSSILGVVKYTEN